MSKRVSAFAQQTPRLFEPLPVTYLSPVIVRRQITWPHKCEAEVQTPEVKQYRTRHQVGMACVRCAKVDFRGKRLCFMHAQMAALEELAGPEPVLTVRT